LVLFILAARAQAPATETTEEILRKGTIVDGNIQKAITAHIADQDINLDKQLPEDKRVFPPILIHKNNEIEFDWTIGLECPA
jgi:hypothetical protein